MMIVYQSTFCMVWMVLMQCSISYYQALFCESILQGSHFYIFDTYEYTTQTLMLPILCRETVDTHRRSVKVIMDVVAYICATTTLFQSMQFRLIPRKEYKLFQVQKVIITTKQQRRRSFYYFRGKLCNNAPSIFHLSCAKITIKEIEERRKKVVQFNLLGRDSSLFHTQAAPTLAI